MSMSLIEKALEKTRSTNRAPTRTEPAPEIRATDPVPVAPLVSALTAPREVLEPELQVSEERLRAIGVRAPDSFIHQQLSEYRHIKRQLLTEMSGSSDAKSRVVLVTSALAGEGKSFSAVNLAMSLALEPDFVTLLVDADVIKPNVSRQFGLVDRRGLMDAALHDDIDVESLVVTTSIPGLSILPAGTPSRNATENFGSARMSQVIRQLLLPQNRIVVIDSLPMLLTTEVRTLVPHAGQVVFVVRAQATPKSAVLQSLDLLGSECNVKLMLNAVEPDNLARYYGYSYNYNYASRS
jgi:receptor protein-tyrosine kinase